MSKTHEKKAGSIYWFFKGELRKLYDGITVPNSIAFSKMVPSPIMSTAMKSC